MGFWQDLTGESAAEASKAAAADTYGKQQGSIKKLLGYGDEYKGGMDTLSKSYDPFISTGLQANDAYSRLLQDPSSVRSLPGYQSTMDEGTRAVDRSAAARGMDQSGRSLKDLTRFSQGNADQFTGNWLQRLMQGAQMGQTATGQQVATESAGLGGQLGARTTAYGGDMTSAGTVGQGDIAAANARASGSQNLLNTGMKIAGMAAAPFTGGMSLGMGMGGGAAPWVPSKAWYNN